MTRAVMLIQSLGELIYYEIFQAPLKGENYPKLPDRLVTSNLGRNIIPGVLMLNAYPKGRFPNLERLPNLGRLPKGVVFEFIANQFDWNNMC